jgi:hypothetical protein
MVPHRSRRPRPVDCCGEPLWARDLARVLAACAEPAAGAAIAANGAAAAAAQRLAAALAATRFVDRDGPRLAAAPGAGLLVLRG